MTESLDQRITSAVAQLSSDIGADIDLTFGRRTGEPRAPATVAILAALVEESTGEQFPLLVPLLSSGVDVALRTAVMSRFDTSPEVAVQSLISAARSTEAKPPHLSSGPDALTFTLREITNSAASLTALLDALRRRKSELKELAVKNPLLGETLTSLGMDDDQAAELRRLLDADRPEAISMLTASHPFGDASAIVSFAPDLERYLRRNQDTGSRDYGTALYLLGEISRLVDVSVAPFVYALRHYPNSNESETAVGAVKRLAKRVARTQDRAALDRFVAQLGRDVPPDLQKFISNLVSPA